VTFAVVITTSDHVKELARNMRNLALTEVEFAGDEKLASRLLEAIKHSTMTWTGLINGKVMFIMGVYPHNMIVGEYKVWLLTAKETDEHPLVLARQSKRILESLLEMCPRLSGYVNAEYKRSIRWLRWLGFSLSTTRVIGDHRVKEFSLERK